MKPNTELTFPDIKSLRQSYKYPKQPNKLQGFLIFPLMKSAKSSSCFQQFVVFGSYIVLPFMNQKNTLAKNIEINDSKIILTLSPWNLQRSRNTKKFKTTESSVDTKEA